MNIYDDLTEEERNLICDLEYIFANSVCNSARGELRYPVTIRDYKKNESWQERCRCKGLSHDEVWSMKYIFGGNTLSIGSALIKTLSMLEERYDLSFNELEKRRLVKENFQE